MVLPIHAISALPAVLLGYYELAAAALLPDAPVAFNAVRGWWHREAVWQSVARVREGRTLKLYAATHSIWPWLALSVGMNQPGWLFGFLIHWILDLPHYGMFAPRLFYPLGSSLCGRAVVPLSGGHDSARCLCVAVASYPRELISAVFVDYGQPQAEKELEAARYVCRELGVSLREVLIPAIPCNAFGSYLNRNFILLRHCMHESLPSMDTTVFIGSRTPLAIFDRHGDCAPSTIRRWLRSEFPKTRAAFPCMCLPDWLIRRSLRANHLDISRLHSSKK